MEPHAEYEAGGHKPPSDALAAAGKLFFNPPAQGLQAVFDADPFTDQAADHQADDQQQEVVRLEGAQQPDQDDRQADGLHDRVRILLGDAAPEQKADQAAGDDGQGVDDGAEQIVYLSFPEMYFPFMVNPKG